MSQPWQRKASVLAWYVIGIGAGFRQHVKQLPGAEADHALARRMAQILASVSGVTDEEFSGVCKMPANGSILMRSTFLGISGCLLGVLHRR